MRLVIFGPQGAGKGTQGVRIAEKYGIPAIATGEIFRWAVAGRTALGLQVLEYVDAGKLVPDELTIKVISERLEADDVKDGFLLDGFPRNIGQAEALDRLLGDRGETLDGALIIEVPEDVSLRRITGRRVCAGCGRNYHVDAPPEHDWLCDSCGAEVVNRSDDLEEAIVRERLKTYYEKTQPLTEYYEKRDLLRRVDGVGSPDEVFTRIVAVL